MVPICYPQQIAREMIAFLTSKCHFHNTLADKLMLAKNQEPGYTLRGIVISRTPVDKCANERLFLMALISMIIPSHS